MSLSIYVSTEARGSKMPSSSLYGRKVLKAPPRTKAGIWPFDKQEKRIYHEFIIAENSDGEPVEHTCNPDHLANNFGANPDAPHYLTPVYFRREVLQRYYEFPEKFSIEASYLSCGGLWGLSIDNDHPDHVMVFLGDLGRDLPESERPYWRTFNIAPIGRPSRTAIRRSLFALPTAPEAPDLRFKSAYRLFKTEWQNSLAGHYFKSPSPTTPTLFSGFASRSTVVNRNSKTKSSA